MFDVIINTVNLLKSVKYIKITKSKKGFQLTLQTIVVLVGLLVFLAIMLWAAYNYIQKKGFEQGFGNIFNKTLGESAKATDKLFE